MFHVHGDPAYGRSTTTMRAIKGVRLTPQQALLNDTMKKLRISVEWGFGGIAQQWGYITYTKGLELFKQPVSKLLRRLPALHATRHAAVRLRRHLLVRASKLRRRGRVAMLGRRNKGRSGGRAGEHVHLVFKFDVREGRLSVPRAVATRRGRAPRARWDLRPHGLALVLVIERTLGDRCEGLRERQPGSEALSASPA